MWAQNETRSTPWSLGNPLHGTGGKPASGFAAVVMRAAVCLCLSVSKTSTATHPTIQEPIFSVANTVQVLKAVTTGVVAACGTLLVR